MNVLLLSMFLGVVAPPYHPVAPPYSGEIVVHLDQPTLKPKTLTHTVGQYLGDGCLMCLGQHLRNYHGQTSTALDKIGYRNWSAYHRKLHAEAVYVAPKPVSSGGCPGGCCPVGPIRRLFGR